MFRRFLFLFISLIFSVVFSFAQSRQGYRFSREESVEILLDQSKKENIKGFVALGGGLALSGISIHFLRKDPFQLSSNGSGMTVSESDNHILGASLLAGGVTLIAGSPFLFIRAGRLKKKAKLLMSNEAASLLDQTISVPSIAFRISF